MSDDAKPKLDRAVVSLGIVSFLTDVASDMVLPLLPVFMTTVLHASLGSVGLVDGTADAVASLLRVVSGPLTDRARARKPVVVLGYAIAAAMRPLLGFAVAPWQIVAIRGTDRVGKGLRSAPRDAWITAITPAPLRARAFGLHRALDNLGGFVGPLIGLLLRSVFGWDLRHVFYFAAVPGFLGVAVLLFVRERVRPDEERPKTAGAPPREPLPSSLRAFLAVLFVFTLANASDSFLVTWAQRKLHASDAAILIGWTVFTGLRALLAQPGALVSDRIGRRASLLLGWIVFAIAYALVSIATSPAVFCAVLVVYVGYYALTEGAERALVADLAPAGSRGWAFGLFHGTMGLAALPASAGFGAIADRWGMPLAFRISASLALAASVALTLVVRAQRAKAPAR